MKFCWQDAFTVQCVRILARAQYFLLVAIEKRSQICDSWPHLQDRLPRRCMELHMLWHLRPGPDQAHVALEHIQKLGQFIELVFPKPRAGSRDACVSGCRNNTTLAAAAHRSKFPYSKQLSVSSDSGLAEKDR